MSTISCDISEFQPVVDDSYTRQWLILRCCDGSHYDLHADANARWARKAKTGGRLDGWTAYVVYRPGQNATIINQLARMGPLDHVMIDVESWTDPNTGIPAIQGNHSTEINQLASLIATLVGQDNVWGYANQGDFEAIWPSRPSWVSIIVAGYGPTQPSGWANLIGWQYTNGSENHTGMPSSSAPFGSCDHNELFFDVHTAQGGGTPIEGDNTMAGLTQAEADMIGAATAKALLTALVSRPDKSQVSLGSAVGALQQYAQGEYQEAQNQTSLLGQAVQKLS